MRFLSAALRGTLLATHVVFALPAVAATVATENGIGPLHGELGVLTARPKLQPLFLLARPLPSGFVISRRARVPLRSDPVALALLSRAQVLSGGSDPAGEALIVVALDGVGKLEVVLLRFHHGHPSRMARAELP